jgi:transcriptional regulator with XRE-family HTH domain
MPDPTIFGRRLRKVRKKRDMSQSDLAEKADLDKTVISHFETGERGFPSAHNLREIAKALNVKSDYLIGLSEEEDAMGSSLAAAFRNFEDQASDDDIANIKAIMKGILEKNE